MTDFGKKITFKYKKVIDAETRKLSEIPAITLVLGEGENSFESNALIDSGSDISLISEDLANELRLILGEEEKAEVPGGYSIRIKPAKVKIKLKKGINIISLGTIRIAVCLDPWEEDGLEVILGRNQIFDMFKIPFEQYKKQVTFEKVNQKWRPY
ncbi:retroviral-like aspartic protease [Candidatus Woesearchaeota archaeon]|nr:retroviral-like aspartic protease [Candidatus Woesearchaeota archaeon]